MQIPVIKKLVEAYSVEQLEDAEAAILEEQAPGIEVEGEDDGEQLTHVMAAVWIMEKMENDQIPFPKAMRAYTAKVRESIN
ncbi:MAG: hypothetical protein JXQ96_09880 [Cyclobacteriaceae bacterium]